MKWPFASNTSLTKLQRGNQHLAAKDYAAAIAAIGASPSFEETHGLREPAAEHLDHAFRTAALRGHPQRRFPAGLRGLRRNRWLGLARGFAATRRRYGNDDPSRGAQVQIQDDDQVELGTRNPAVRVNCILPGWINTGLSEAAKRNNQDLEERVMARTPAGRWGETVDLVGCALFLASMASDFVTGAAIPVDGGYAAQG